MNRPSSPLVIPILAFAALLPVGLVAAVRPASIFQDNAVLQRGKPVPVWGAADPGEPVKVSFAGQEVKTVADASGKWSVTLPPMEASFEARTLEISGTNTVTLSNVLVGEVWIASGQSNMEWVMSNSHDTDMEARTARFPHIREVKVKRTPLAAPASSFEGTWKVATPETVGGFSAVAYFFAKDVHLALSVPVGIINTSFGGTAVESWMSERMLAADPAFKVVAERFAKLVETHPQRQAQFQQSLAKWREAKAAAEAKGERFTVAEPRAPQGPDSHARPSSLYNGMVAPLVPYAIRGAIWYQGESNAGRHAEYNALFAAMINGWRADFAQGDFPFFWVQLAAYRASGPEGVEWAFLREAQHRTLALPNTGQALAIDVAAADIGDIHPRAKGLIGRRLARLALNRAYGDSSLADSGPFFDAAAFQPATGPGRDGGPAELRVSFLPADRRVRQPLGTLTGFEVAGADKVFHPAEARVDAGVVYVKSAAVPVPVAVRYAWRNAPVAALQDNLGLPVAPFRSDTW